LWSLPLIAGGTLLVTDRADLAFWLSGGYLFSGLMFGPDLDLYSIHYKRWGWLRWLWRPYQQAIKHRSIWSHGPIVGTIGRILYLSLWVGLIGLCYLEIVRLNGGKTYTEQQLIAIVKQAIESNFPVYLAGFCGLELGAMSHYTSDWVVSTFNRSPLAKIWQRNTPNSSPSKPKKMPAKQAKKKD
jgi:uncharacterized metal-binding protein